MSISNPSQVVLNALQADFSDGWILCIPSSIGEVACTLSLLDAFREAHGGPIRIAVHRNHLSVCQLFSEKFDSHIGVSTMIVRDLVTTGQILTTSFSRGSPICVWANCIHDGHFSRLYTLHETRAGRGGLSLFDSHRYMMRLSWESRISRGRINVNLRSKALHYCQINNIDAGNSVIFFPGNNTNKPTSILLWRRLAENFRRQRKKVFICIAGARLVPDGVDNLGPQLNMDAALAVAVIDIAGHVVAGGNGLAFLTMLTESQSQIDIFLPEAIIDEKSKSYKNVHPFVGSARLNALEALTSDRVIREWDLSSISTYDDATLDTLAEAIAHVDSDHRSQLRSPQVEDFILSNYRSQLKR